MKTERPDDLMSFREAARMMGVSVKLVQRFVRTRRLDVWRFSPRNLRVRRGDVLALMENCKVRT